MRATATMGGSMPPKSNIDTSTYSGRIAARIRELREARGWTVKELANRINAAGGSNLANSTVHGWDNGSRSIDCDFLPTVAKVFGLSVRSFLPVK